jgi:hypothetical protein
MRRAPAFLALHVDNEAVPMALKTQFPFEDETYGITGSALPGDRI